MTDPRVNGSSQDPQAPGPEVEPLASVVNGQPDGVNMPRVDLPASPDQQLQALVARAQANPRVAQAVAYFNRAAAITPAPVYSTPASRYSAGANS